MSGYAIIAALILFPTLCTAQPARKAEARVAVAALYGTSSADAATLECCPLRTRPVLVRIREGDTSRRWVGGVDGRFYWTPRTSTFLQFDATRERTWQFTYPRPAARPLPFDSYEAERRVWSRHSRWMVGQTVEFLKSGRWRPFVSGAVAIRRFAERQHELTVGFTDPTSRSESATEWRRREVMLAAGGGVRVHVAGRAFVGAELVRGFWGTHACTDCGDQFSPPFTLAAPRFVSFRAMAGVMF